MAGRRLASSPPLPPLPVAPAPAGGRCGARAAADSEAKATEARRAARLACGSERLRVGGTQACPGASLHARAIGFLGEAAGQSKNRGRNAAAYPPEETPPLTRQRPASQE